MPRESAEDGQQDNDPIQDSVGPTLPAPGEIVGHGLGLIVEIPYDIQLPDEGRLRLGGGGHLQEDIDERPVAPRSADAERLQAVPLLVDIDLELPQEELLGLDAIRIRQAFVLIDDPLKPAVAIAQLQREALSAPRYRGGTQVFWSTQIVAR